MQWKCDDCLKDHYRKTMPRLRSCVLRHSKHFIAWIIPVYGPVMSQQQSWQYWQYMYVFCLLLRFVMSISASNNSVLLCWKWVFYICWCVCVIEAGVSLRIHDCDMCKYKVDYSSNGHCIHKGQHNHTPILTTKSTLSPYKCFSREVWIELTPEGPCGCFKLKENHSEMDSTEAVDLFCGNVSFSGDVLVVWVWGLCSCP